MGTHNLLLALGPSVYLEVIAPDPAAAAIARPRWFGLDQVVAGRAARLAAWVASTDTLAQGVAPELGPIETMWRGARSWQMTVRPDGSLPMEGAAPLLIQRPTDAQPMAGMADLGLRLRRLRVLHRSPHRVLDLLQRIGLDGRSTVEVMPGDACRLVAEIETPTGLRTLGEA